LKARKKNNMKKCVRIIVVALALVSMVSLLCTPSLAASQSDFVVKNGVLTEYNGKSANINIPSNLGITAIGETAFQHNWSFTTVSIPEGVTTINDKAFDID
jgi:hypothetical protein